jgi:hypothetical protein
MVRPLPYIHTFVLTDFCSSLVDLHQAPFMHNIRPALRRCRLFLAKLLFERELLILRSPYRNAKVLIPT